MADQIRTIETKKEAGGISAMAFILGGVVVAVAIIGYFMYGGSPKHVDGGSTNTSVTIEAPAASAPATTAPAAPAPDAAAPAPAAPAPAPAAPAPAAP